MPRSETMTKASGRELISQTHEIWSDYRDQIPVQQRNELGQVLTELGTRINYTCQGQQPQTRTRYSTLGGAELASHAWKTVQKTSQQLPVEVSTKLSLVIGEMASRVRYAAEGEPQTQQQAGNGESFDFTQHQSESSKQGSVTFA